MTETLLIATLVLVVFNLGYGIATLRSIQDVVKEK